MTHPLKHPDPDVGCRWMCEAIHSAGDEDVMRDVLDSLPFRASPLPPSPCPVNTWDTNYMTATQIRNALKRVTSDKNKLHRQRIKREMTKRGALMWHGVLALESTAATQFIASHVPDNAQGCDAQNVDTTRPNG